VQKCRVQLQLIPGADRHGSNRLEPADTAGNQILRGKRGASTLRLLLVLCDGLQTGANAFDDQTELKLDCLRIPGTRKVANLKVFH